MKIVAIDGNSMVFRAYFAFVKSQLANDDGLETGAIHGFINMLTNIVETYNPDQIFVAFDLPEDTFRHQLIQDYKGGRPDTPESLIVQLLLIKEILQLLGIPVYELPGYEADDLLATIATTVKGMGGQIIVVSGDRDIFQLVEDPFVKVLYPVKGLSQTTLFDEAAIFEKTGVLPKDYPLYATLRGDPSDNLPGVNKVGEKTAALLTNEYGSLDSIYENLDKLKPAIAESFKSAKDRIYQIFDIVHLKRDLELNYDFTPRYKMLSKIDDLESYFNKLQIVQSWSRLKKILSQNSATISSSAISEMGIDPLVETETLSTDQVIKVSRPTGMSGDMGSEFEKVSGNELFSSDDFKSNVRFVKLSPREFIYRFLVNDDFKIKPKMLMTCSYLGEPGRSRLNWFAFCHLGDIEIGDLIKSDNFNEVYFSIFVLDEISEYDISEILPLLYRVELIGESIKEFIRSLNLSFKVRPSAVFDIRIAAFLCEPAWAKLSAVSLLHVLLAQDHLSSGATITPRPNQAPSTGKLELPVQELNSPGESSPISSDIDLVSILSVDFMVIVDLYNLLTARLVNFGEMKLFRDVEMPVSDCLTEMELEGIMVDREKLKAILSELETMKLQLSASIFGLVGHSFNIGSPKQLGGVLYDELGLQSFKNTKTGRSTNANTLEKLRGLHPVVDLVLQYREVDKLRSTYGVALIKTIESDNRIHATFSLTSARTGRISSENPNLHNIPVRTNLGMRFREVFVSKPNFQFIIADYDQIELRLLAYYSRDLNLLTAFENGIDIHSYVASVVFSIPVEDVDKTRRNIAKMVSYGLVYGMEAFGLAERLTISVTEAKEILVKYFASFPALKSFIEDSIVEAKVNGYVKTILGRRRNFDELNSMDRMHRMAMERQAANSIIQGSAADLFKMAIIRLNSKLKSTNIDAALVLQIHDELIVECIANQIDETIPIVKAEMESVGELGIPLTLHLNTGFSWAEKRG